MISIIKKTFILLWLSALPLLAKANDGAFYSEGNQLIPVTETDISVKKEILKIKRVNREYTNFYEVTVYYEFYNPTSAKDLLVGFEAIPPSPGLGTDTYPDHPGIHHFKVIMNGEDLPYEVAHVPYPRKKDGNFIWKVGGYYKNGTIQNLSRKQCEALYGNDEDGYYYDIDPFYYVYHFNAHFNNGLNTIQHTYFFDGAGDVMTEYRFDYVLTAANRWANNGIDDFTLEIDMGDRESFPIAPTFYKDISEWTFNGKGKAAIEEYHPIYDEEIIRRPIFHVQQGSVVFRKKNFHPEGELSIVKPIFYYYSEESQPYANRYFKPEQFHNFLDSDMDAETIRILRNLPFAYRGYVFKSPSLQRFFESTSWYIPNPDYEGKVEEMSEEEQEWIQTMSE